MRPARPRWRRAVEQEADRADLVGQRDPAHHLAAVAEPGQHAEAGPRQPPEHAAAGAEDEAAAQVNDADPGVAGGRGGGLPVGHHPGQEGLARGRVLGDRGAAGIAVPADRGGDDERRGPGRQTHQGGGERPGREHPAGPDLRLVGGGPAVVADPGASQVNARGHAGQDRVARVGGVRIPADLVGGARRPPDQADDLVAVRLQACRQRGPDQPGRAGDRYLHRSQHAGR